MPCRSPLLVQKKGHLRKIPVPCGKCPPCRKRKVDEWVLRLMEEDKISDTAYFITLTYTPKTVPITPNKFMTLRKSDYQKFMKRLRKSHSGSALKQLHELNTKPIKYYAVGEYGDTRKRPHYHAIIFNVKSPEEIEKAWTLDGELIGTVHVGRVSGNSIAYTLKYMDKGSKVPAHKRDDRLKEFALMSKGLGASWITEEKKKFYNENLDKTYTMQNGYRKAMPRFYRDRILTEENNNKQIDIIRKKVHDRSMKNYKEFLKSCGKTEKDLDYEEYLSYIKAGESYTFFKNHKKRDYD